MQRLKQPSLLLLSVLLVNPVPVSGAGADDPNGNLSNSYDKVDPNKPVLCLLPGRVRQLGGRLTYLEPRKPRELTASECRIRGGEFTLYDRANYETALAVWLAAAEEGDATAQIYAGEIYEKGWIGEPDYAEAARWYQMASEQGDVRAHRRLAYFYENGIGVSEDRDRALALWRDALQLDEDLVLASDLEAAKSEAERRIDGLLAQIETQNQKTLRLQNALAERESILLAEREELALVRDEAQALERALAEAETTDPARVRELEAELAARATELGDQQIAIELLQAEVDVQRAQVASSARQADIRQTQLDKAEAELAASQAERDRLLAQLSTQQTVIGSIESQLAEVRTSLAEARDREVQLAEALVSSENVAPESDPAFDTAVQELAEARAQIARQERSIQTLESSLSETRQSFELRLQAADLRETELATALNASRSDQAALAERLAGAETELHSQRAEIEQVQTALVNARVDRGMMLKRLEAMESRDDNQSAELLATIEAQEGEIARLESQNEALTTNWQTLAAERDRMQTELSGQSDWFKAEMTRENSRMIALQREQENYKLALEEASFNVQRLTSETERLQMDLARSQSGSAAQIQMMETQLAQARAELREKVAKLSEMEIRNAELIAEASFQGNQVQSRMLAMRGLETRAPAQPVIELPSGINLGRYRALVIANYDYQFIPGLTTPQADAQALKTLLEQDYGFDVTLGINLNYREMLAALNELREYGEKDFALVYYAGHGKMDENGDGYWLPTDYIEGESLDSTAISSTDITSYLDRSPARHVFLVADSCYAGALLRQQEAMPTFKASPSVLVRHWINQRSRTALTSGGLKPVLDQAPNSRHSVFAEALLTTLASSKGPINGSMLHAQVQHKVQVDAAKLGYLDQVPQFATIEDAGHGNGQFVFVPRRSSTAAD